MEKVKYVVFSAFLLISLLLFSYGCTYETKEKGFIKCAVFESNNLKQGFPTAHLRFLPVGVAFVYDDGTADVLIQKKDGTVLHATLIEEDELDEEITRNFKDESEYYEDIFVEVDSDYYFAVVQFDLDYADYRDNWRKLKKLCFSFKVEDVYDSGEVIFGVVALPEDWSYPLSLDDARHMLSNREVVKRKYFSSSDEDDWYTFCLDDDDEVVWYDGMWYGKTSKEVDSCIREGAYFNIVISCDTDTGVEFYDKKYSGEEPYYTSYWDIECNSVSDCPGGQWKNNPYCKNNDVWDTWQNLFPTKPSEPQSESLAQFTHCPL